jgi:hypothetical protein
MGGIFSTKRETKAFTAIQRMSDDDSIILSSQTAVMHYILEGAGKTSTSISDKSLPNYLIEYSQRALPRRCEQAYNYANSGHYAYGLPTAGEATVQGVNLSTAVKAYLDATSGHTVTMVYAFIGDANYQHFLWKKLEDEYGYNPTTNELEALSITEGFPCYLQTGKLVFGSATVQSTESGSVMEQYGYSTESGECTARSQNLGAAPVSPDVDTDVTDAYAEFSYQYIEVIPDVTDPPDAVVNTLSTTSIDGYAEKDSSVQILVNTVLTTTVTASSTGYFTYTFGTALTAGDVVKTIVVDAAANTSAGVDKTVPYTNGSPATVGTDKTITEIVHTESFSFDFLDYIPSAVATLPSAPDTPPITIVGSDAFVQEYDYIQACYTYVVGAVTHIAYLTYEHGSGTISALDDLFEMSVATGKFYPRLYSRLNSQSLPTTLSTSSSEYKSSKRLAKLMGIDWVEWSASLHSSIADIADVRQIFLMIAAPMNTSDPVIIEYQYRYWQKMYDELTTTVTTGALAGTGARIGKVLEIKDTKYSNYIGFNAVNVTTVTGTIGTVGTYNSEYVNAKRAYTDANYAANTGRGALSAGLLTLLPAYHVYRYQDTLTTYKEVKVFGAGSTHSFSGFSTSSAGTDDNLVIPIDKTVVVYLSSNEKEILFGKCFYLVVNLTKVIKTAWYARGAFKVIMVVVAVVITVFTAGAGAGIGAFLINLATNIAIGALINIIITELVKTGIISGKFAAFVAAVAFILGALKGKVDVKLLNLTAVQLMTVSMLAFQITAKTYEFQYKKLQQEASAFSAEAQEKQAALSKAKELLGDPLIPLELELLVSNDRSKVFITLGESPDDFMAKGSMNVIDTLQGFVSNYVEIMMQPPNLQQLLNQSQRGDDDGRITA